MLHVSSDVERALLGKLRMTFYIQASLLGTASSIDQRIGCARNDLHLDALAILDMDGSTTIDRRRIGQRQTIQLDSCLIGTRHIKFTIRRSA